jgi:hypothetical protein
MWRCVRCHWGAECPSHLFAVGDLDQMCEYVLTHLPCVVSRQVYDGQTGHWMVQAHNPTPAHRNRRA